MGHSVENHPDGFSSPIGSLKGINLAIEDMSPRDLSAYDIYEGEKIEFEFEGGIKVKGEIITGTRNLQGKIILISLKDCTVTYGDEILFKPEWGKYDMAIGKEVISAFAGPADNLSFDLITHKTSSTTIKSKNTPEREELNSLYASVRNIRGGKDATFSLDAALDLAKKHHQKDWLLSVEIYEMVVGKDEKLTKEVLNHLEDVKSKRPDISHLIDGGINLIDAQLVK